MSKQDMPSSTGEDQGLVKFHIDQSWYEDNHRSFQSMIDTRVSSGPSLDPPTRTKRKKASVTSMADLSKIEGFVGAELPILEAIFRLLLIHENKPMDTEEISQELAERGIGIIDSRTVRPAALTRILDHDTHYGLRRSERH